MPAQLADERHRLLPPAHRDVAEDLDGVVRADDGVPARHHYGVHLAQAADRPAAVTDELAVSEVLVGGGVGRHEPVVTGAGSGVRFDTGLYCLV